MAKNTITFINCDDTGLIPFDEVKGMTDGSDTVVIHLRGNRKSVLLKKSKDNSIVEEVRSRLIEF